MPTVTVNPSGKAFACEGRQTILEAALSASVSLGYGCSMGTCGCCQVRLLQGDIEKVKHHDFTIKEADRLNGCFLSCAYTAASDVVVEAIEATSSADIPHQKIQAKIKGLKKITPEIGVLSVQTPRSMRLRFLPSQNVRLTLSDAVFTDLPIASCPCDDRNLEFHIRWISEDPFSSLLFEQKSFPSSIQIDGPWGQVHENYIDTEFVFLAFDTQVSAAKSLMEQQLANESEHPVDLIWFAAEGDFYLSNLLLAWADAFDSFSYELISTEEQLLPSSVDRAISQISKARFRNKQTFVTGPEKFQHAVAKSFGGIGVSRERLWNHLTKRSLVTSC